MGHDSEIQEPPLTPMLAQYREIKKKHADCILLYRMGDFYEMFFEDALTAAPVLEVTLTSRDRSAAAPIPMCGVPFHSITPYIQKLIAKGFKVAICEQVEDPAVAKGIVKREVTRVITPALVGDPDLVSEETTYLLAAVWPKKNALEICFFDLFANVLRYGEVESEENLAELFSQKPPKEILIPASLLEKAWLKAVCTQFPLLVVTERDEYFNEKKETTIQALKKYLTETQKHAVKSTANKVLPLFESDRMELDSTTIQALELLPNPAREESRSLFHILDHCSTSMGRRLLKEWIVSPLKKAKPIRERWEAIEWLVENLTTWHCLKGEMESIRDLERLTTKTSLGLSMPRDLVAIREIQKRIPALKTLLKKSKSPLWQKLGEDLDELKPLTAKMEKALEDEPPAILRDGGIFKASFHAEIHELRSLSQDAKTTIANIETREKERTGISSLKVKYSKVFGYTIEITKSHLTKIPPEYIRKQTIANGERFITEELKKFEDKVLTAEERLKKLEESLFFELRAEVGSFSEALFQNARTLAQIDVLGSLTQVARERSYVKPTLSKGDTLDIVNGRHPVVEAILNSGNYVPNSVAMSEDDGRTLIITGPNMGGKSTIMRQVALISLLAQMGSFVPATQASLPLFDAIFTRIGSSDDLSRGRSTFMVEMSEVARILERATDQSLILIDEIGRGTSTYDGLSLAWSLLEYIHQNVKAKTLFATHFHELTLLEKSLPALKNMNVLVDKWKDGIVFLYKLAPGICNRSYGIEVAKLAGLPPKVLLRARDLLGLLETQSQRGNRTRHRALEIHTNQMGFFDGDDAPEAAPGLEN